MDVAKKYQNELERLKDNVKNSYQYFQPNYQRFNKLKKFVFDTSLDETDRMVLTTLGKPQIEFNICEAYISRLRGEFFEQQPSIIVTSRNGFNVPYEVIQFVENHLRYIIHDASKNSFGFKCYTDTLAGGFSAMKLWTEYEHEMSFDQVIRTGKVYDATLAGFDPLARETHKGDGRFCFELFPKSKKEFEEEYPEIDISSIDFTRNVNGFSWSYNNNQEDILLICDFYEKTKKKKKIVQLANDYVMTKDDYKIFIEKWKESELLEQPPIIKSERFTEIETIVRYRFIQNKVIEYVETDYPALPIIFVDGNSVELRNGTDQGSFIQMTRPFIYHLQGLQKLKNFAGQTLANELENMVQHKFKVAKESLPDEPDYLAAYTDVQTARVLVYKAFKDNDPKVAVPAPIEIQRVPPPAEVMNTFQLIDSMSQTVLGSYDASLGINNNQLSGRAIIQGANHSNATAMPYIIGYLQALTQLANIIVKMIPLYYVTPRTVPIIDRDGKRSFSDINQKGGIYPNYDKNALQVNVEAGTNFAVQKERTLSQVVQLSQSMPLFSQFMNSKGLKVLIDNFDFQGQDQLKELAEEYMQELQEQQKMQQQQQQQAMQNNPYLIKAKNEQAKIQLDAQQLDVENQFKAAELKMKKEKLDQDFMKVMNEVNKSKAQVLSSKIKADAEETRAAVDLAIKHIDMKHSHEMDKKRLINNEGKKDDYTIKSDYPDEYS